VGAREAVGRLDVHGGYPHLRSGGIHMAQASRARDAPAMPRSSHQDPIVPVPTAAIARAALRRVQAERFEALAAGVSGQYVARLEKAIANARRRYVISAVTELATLRAELHAPQVG
jgi:hypothetical protein